MVNQSDENVHAKNKYDKQKVSIEEYLTYQGHELHRPNSKGYCLVDDHDSLYVNINDNKFTWFARNTGGSIFGIMRELDGITDYEDQKALLKQIQSERTEVFSPTTYEVNEKKEFNISDFEITKLSQQSKQYLTDVRKIHPILVNALAESGFLVDRKQTYEAKNGKQYNNQNLVYMWKNVFGQPVGGDAQATKKNQSKSDDKHQGYWKGILPGSPASKYGFSMKVGKSKEIPDRLVVVEAPIDAISHWQMNLKDYKQKDLNVAYLSLSGVKDSVLNHYIKEQYWNEDEEKFNLPKEIHYAVDNDKAGRDLVRQSGNMLENFAAFDAMEKLVDVPSDLTVKDWNDQLRFGANLETKTVPLSEIEDVPMFSKPEIIDKEKLADRAQEPKKDVLETQPSINEAQHAEESNKVEKQSVKEVAEAQVINAEMTRRVMQHKSQELPIG